MRNLKYVGGFLNLMERELTLIVGVALIAVAFVFAPSSHHYMMMGPYYLAVIPLIFTIAGIALILFSAFRIFEAKRSEEKSEIEEKCEDDKMGVVEKLLEGDELEVFKIIRENEGVTQDSLHFRTGFSPSKVSMIVKKLEEKNLIYRERFGKTYRIYLSDWLKKNV